LQGAAGVSRSRVKVGDNLLSIRGESPATTVRQRTAIPYQTTGMVEPYEIERRAQGVTGTDADPVKRKVGTAGSRSQMPRRRIDEAD